MKAFTFDRPDSVVAAAKAVAGKPSAKFIAGGTNLLDLMKLEVEKPTHLVDVNRLPLASVEDTKDGGLQIGALVRNSDLAADPRVRKNYGVLSRALLAGASGQLRNKATTAGNLCSEHVAIISTTSRNPATSATPDRAVRRWKASIASTRSSAPAKSASPSIPPIWPSECKRLTRRSRP